jgi:hypothetical protein
LSRLWREGGGALQLTKYGHSCLLVEEGPARLLLDPGTLSGGFEELEGLTAPISRWSPTSATWWAGGCSIRATHSPRRAGRSRCWRPGRGAVAEGVGADRLPAPGAPKGGLPVHELVLSQAGKAIHYRQLEQLGGATLRVLDDGALVGL